MLHGAAKTRLLINLDKMKLLLIGARQMLQNTPACYFTVERVVSGCFSEGPSWSVYGRCNEFLSKVLRLLACQV